MSKPLTKKRLAKLETLNRSRRSLDDGQPVGLDQTECRELIAEVRRLRADNANLTQQRTKWQHDALQYGRERDEALARVKELEARSDD